MAWQTAQTHSKMAIHISQRLAWHADGWNGKPCREPHLNTYCVGRYSYPGEAIREKRIIEESTSSAGEKQYYCKPVNGALPCAYSCNAFGKEAIIAREEPPAFFGGGADGIDIKVPEATAFVWPYE